MSPPLRPRVKLVLVIRKMSYVTTEPLLRRVFGGWIVTAPNGTYGRYAPRDACETLSLYVGDATRFSLGSIEHGVHAGYFDITPVAWDQNKKPVEYRVTRISGVPK